MSAPSSAPDPTPTDTKPDGWLQLRLFYRAVQYRWLKDRAEIAAVLAHVRPGSLAIDIGAHKGGYTYWLTRGVGRTGKVVAFEPQPVLARKLSRCVAADRVTVVNAAVSDRDSTLPLNVPGDGASSPGASLESPAAVGGRTIHVPVVQLDRFLSGRALPVSFIKIDVEGHELTVFRGAEAVLRRDRPVLLFECEQRHHSGRPIAEVFCYLNSLGYAGWFFDQGKLRPVAEFDPTVHQRDLHAAGYVNNFLFKPTGTE